jgi:enterochelin esterase family protein
MESRQLAETVHAFRSAHLGNERSIWIREPAVPSRPYGLTIFLDGELYRDRVGAIATIDDLEARAALANSLFVSVSMHSEEARWIECPCHQPFADFINGELVPWLEAKYPAVKKSAERVLIGLSYTGLAAAFVAMKAPGAFTHVVAQSGSFWWNDCWLVEQFRGLETRLPTAFYLDVGLKETDENVRHKEDVLQVVSQIDAIRRLRDVMLDQGYAVKYVEFDGGHEFVAWQKTLPVALRWALPAGTKN